MVKGIIFDLNGVFIQSPKLSDRIKKDFGISTKVFLPALKEILSKSYRPEVEDSFELWQPYLKKWKIDLDREAFFHYWFVAEKEDDELIEFVRGIRERGIKTAVISNNFKERTEYYFEHFSFLSEIFDEVCFSWQTGYVKPGLKAYEKVLQDLNLNPFEVLYFDDSDNNIAAAKSIGIRSFSYSNLKDLKEIIKNS